MGLSQREIDMAHIAISIGYLGINIGWTQTLRLAFIEQLYYLRI